MPPIAALDASRYDVAAAVDAANKAFLRDKVDALACGSLPNLSASILPAPFGIRS
jgi:hypothetical protein